MPDVARDLYAAVLQTVREAAADVLADRSARLVEDVDDFGPVIRLIPRNPAACELMVYSDQPTLCLGAELHCTDLWALDEKNLGQLRQLVTAVIAGNYEWRHRQVLARRFLGFRKVRETQLVGTFRTEDGPWIFTRQGTQPAGAVQHRTYEPY